MDEYYIGEIRIFGAGFAPSGWHICDGSLIPIEQNTALFSLISTTYGGDGLKTFALPDLRSRIPLGMSSLRPIGTIGGAERITLGVENLPSHGHTPACNNTEEAILKMRQTHSGQHRHKTACGTDKRQDPFG
jgi:microcystin-dependent protein